MTQYTDGLYNGKELEELWHDIENLSEHFYEIAEDIEDNPIDLDKKILDGDRRTVQSMLESAVDRIETILDNDRKMEQSGDRKCNVKGLVVVKRNLKNLLEDADDLYIFRKNIQSSWTLQKSTQDILSISCGFDYKL